MRCDLMRFWSGAVKWWREEGGGGGGKGGKRGDVRGQEGMAEDKEGHTKEGRRGIQKGTGEDKKGNQ